MTGRCRVEAPGSAPPTLSSSGKKQKKKKKGSLLHQLIT